VKTTKEDPMTRFLAALVSVSLVACANPAKGKPRAEVGAAKPETAPADKLAAGTQRFTLAPDTSTITLKGSKPTRTHVIKVPAFTGTIDVPAGKPLEAKIAVTIDMTKIEADDAKLTRHLQSGDFFETEHYPTATFVSTGIVAGGDEGATHTITGNLEMRGVKKSISFPATVAITGDKVSAKAEFVINRKDWGIVYPGMADDLIRDEVVNAPLATGQAS
jgi:polyisoprenoid-binding protein YceI